MDLLSVQANQISPTDLCSIQANQISRMDLLSVQANQIARMDLLSIQANQIARTVAGYEIYQEIKSLAWSQSAGVTNAGSPSVKPSRHRTISDRTKGRSELEEEVATRKSRTIMYAICRSTHKSRLNSCTRTQKTHIG